MTRPVGLQVNNAMVMNHLLVNYQTERMQGSEFSMKGRTVSSVLRGATDVQEMFTPSGLNEMQFEDEQAETSQRYVEVF